MPGKGRKKQPDTTVNKATVDLDLDLASEKRLAAFEVRNGVLTLGLIQSPSKAKPHDLDDSLRRFITPLVDGLTLDKLKELLPDPGSCFILTTKESYPQLLPIKRAGHEVMIIDRARAIYHAHKQYAEGGEPCLVVQEGADQTSCSLIVNGEVATEATDTGALSHAGIWRSFVESQRLLARTIGFYSPKDHTFEQALFEGFISAWKTGNGAKVGKYSFANPIDLGSSVGSFKRLFTAADPNNDARLVVVSDWAAAHCNLGALLRTDYEVVGDDNPRGAFTQAFDGLVLFGLNHLAIQQRPRLELSKKKLSLPRVTQGESVRTELRIKNAGGGLLHAKLIPDDPWLKVIPDVVTCGKGRDQLVNIEADTSKLTAGLAQTSGIEIEWSDSVSDKRENIPVRLDLVAPPVVLGSVKKLIPKSKPEVRPAEPLLDVTAATKIEPKPLEPAPTLLPHEAVEESDDARLDSVSVRGPVLDQTVDPKRPGPLRYILVIAILVVPVALFLMFYRPRVVAPVVANTNASPSGPASVPGNANLSVANPLPSVVVAATPAAGTTPFPLQVANQNNPTPAVDKLVQAGPADSGTPQPGAVPDPTMSPGQIAAGYERQATELFRQQRYDEAIGLCNGGLAVDPANESLTRLKSRIEKAKEILAKPREKTQPQAVENPSPAAVSTPKPVAEKTEPAVMTSQASVSYPLAAKNARVVGTVVVAVTINEQGRVTSATAISGPPMLRNAATEAAKRCIFRPARRGTVPVASSAQVSFKFVL